MSIKKRGKTGKSKKRGKEQKKKVFIKCIRIGSLELRELKKKVLSYRLLVRN